MHVQPTASAISTIMINVAMYVDLTVLILLVTFTDLTVRYSFAVIIAFGHKDEHKGTNMCIELIQVKRLQHYS